MNKGVKDLGKSVKGRLLNLAQEKGVRYQQLLTRYFQERLLYRLSRSLYRENFVLKGGALLYAYEQFVARPTLDIDFMGQHINNDKENILRAIADICTTQVEEDGVTFFAETLKADDITIEKKYPGIRISVEVAMDTIRQTLSMDIGFGDIVVPHPLDLDYPALFPAFGEPYLLAYSLETVVAEKYQTIIERSLANSRMKDYYDLYRLLLSQSFEPKTLKEAIATTFSNRGTILNFNDIFFTKEFRDHEDLNSRWNAYVKKMKLNDIPSFAEIVSFIQDQLSKI